MRQYDERLGVVALVELLGAHGADAALVRVAAQELACSDNSMRRASVRK